MSNNNNNNTWTLPEMWSGYPLDGDIGQEFIVPSLSLLHDKATAERYKIFIDEFNSLGCTSFILTSEQIAKLLNNEEDG